MQLIEGARDGGGVGAAAGAAGQTHGGARRLPAGREFEMRD